MKTKFNKLLSSAKITKEILFYKKQEALGDFIFNKYQKTGKDIFCDQNNNTYIFIKGSEPVCFVAHLDTFFEKSLTALHESDETDQLVLSASTEDQIHKVGLGADDRAGVLANLYFLENSDASILFTYDEEIGCLGIRDFIKSDIYLKAKEDINLWIEFDRAGMNDYVTYNYRNDEVFKILERAGFKEKKGTSSDVAVLSENSNVLGINLSSGYYNNHHVNETFIPDILFKNIKKIEKIKGELAQEKRICYK